MTVRAWFTISALVVAALGAAFAFRLFAAGTVIPEVRVRVGDVRLDGALVTACWPGRNGKLACDTGRSAPDASAVVPPAATFRVTAAYPVQPPRGSVRVRVAGSGEDVLRSAWKRQIRYSLRPGTYVLTATARYPQSAFIRYTFRFRVSRSGS